MKKIFDPLQQKWQQLSAKDKFALTILWIFLFATFGVYGGWQLHTTSKKQQQKFEKKIGDYFWLRSQSANLKDPTNNGADPNSQNNSPQTDPSQEISNILQGFGVQNPQVVSPSANKVQFNFQTNDQIMINQALNELINKGFQFDNLQITQDPSQADAMINVDALINIS